MAIPLISNVGFTEVSSSGVLNDKAGTAKSKLPIQLFKLSGAISGNLTLNNVANNKKIILERAKEWNKRNKEARKLILEREKRNKLKPFWEVNVN